MRREQWSGRRSLRTWRVSVRTRTIGGRLLGIVAAPSREAAEIIAARLFKLSSEERSRLWLVDLVTPLAQKSAVPAPKPQCEAL
jgi:hypothetical protein